MSMPGFSAEASLFTAGEGYRDVANELEGAALTRVLPQSCSITCDDATGYWGCKVTCGPRGPVAQ